MDPKIRNKNYSCVHSLNTEQTHSYYKDVVIIKIHVPPQTCGPESSGASASNQASQRQKRKSADCLPRSPGCLPFGHNRKNRDRRNKGKKRKPKQIFQERADTPFFYKVCTSKLVKKSKKIIKIVPKYSRNREFHAAAAAADDEYENNSNWLEGTETSTSVAAEAAEAAAVAAVAAVTVASVLAKTVSIVAAAIVATAASVLAKTVSIVVETAAPAEAAAEAAEAAPPPVPASAPAPAAAAAPAGAGAAPAPEKEEKEEKEESEESEKEEEKEDVEANEANEGVPVIVYYPDLSMKIRKLLPGTSLENVIKRLLGGGNGTGALSHVRVVVNGQPMLSGTDYVFQAGDKLLFFGLGQGGMQQPHDEADDRMVRPPCIEYPFISSVMMMLCKMFKTTRSTTFYSTRLSNFVFVFPFLVLTCRILRVSQQRNPSSV